MVEWYTRGFMLKQRSFKWGLFHVIVHASNPTNSQIFRFSLFPSKLQSCVPSKWQTRFLEPITWQKSHSNALWYVRFCSLQLILGISFLFLVGSLRISPHRMLSLESTLDVKWTQIAWEEQIVLQSRPKEYFQNENQNRFYVRTSPVKSSKIKL